MPVTGESCRTALQMSRRASDSSLSRAPNWFAHQHSACDVHKLIRETVRPPTTSAAREHSHSARFVESDDRRAYATDRPTVAASYRRTLGGGRRRRPRSRSLHISALFPILDSDCWHIIIVSTLHMRYTFVLPRYRSYTTPNSIPLNTRYYVRLHNHTVIILCDYNQWNTKMTVKSI